MSQNESTTILFWHPWDVLSVEPPQSPICINVSVVCARYVLKRHAGVRIPDSVSKTQTIFQDEETIKDLYKLCTFIKKEMRILDEESNVIYFGDVEDEQRYIFNIQSFWAAISENENSITAVLLHNDLVKRNLTWDIVSEDVLQDQTQSIEESKKKTIASIKAASMISKRKNA